MNKKVVLYVLLAIAAAVGFWYFTKPGDQTVGTPSQHVWNTEASTEVTLIEYGDFQCPGCAQYFPILKEIKQRYEGVITFQFKHFPLESIHQNARAGARAAEAAGLQGKFWEMHDYLFENQTAWSNAGDPLSLFESYAQAIGVTDLAKFTEDFKSKQVAATITADLEAGRALGVDSTPSFVLNGKKLQENPAANVDAFVEMLDSAITEAGGTPPSAESTTPTEEDATPAEETTTTE